MHYRLFLILVSILTATTICAVPANRNVLDSLLASGDTAAFLRMTRHEHALAMRTQHAPERSSARRAPKEFGVSPMLAERGLLILASFKDKDFNVATTRAEIDSMMNGYAYRHNGATGSAAQYFSDQSHGAYRPHFDVVGPVELPQKMAYYGANDHDEQDQYYGEFVLQACSIASALPGVDFSNYDADGDGVMDFVYLIYPGYAESAGAAANTIWPASYDMESAVLDGYTTLPTNADPSAYTFDGVRIGSFAYSSELNGTRGTTRCGIGTPTHEFCHVLGLPDLYDTEYQYNYDFGLTPDVWSIMDYGSDLNNGRTPCNLSAWEKAFLGFVSPTNLGTTGCNATLYPAQSDSYNVLQLNASGSLQSPTSTGIYYYLEYREKTGWDAYLPGHGMLVWKVDYNRNIWLNNLPNNTRNNPRLTILSASGEDSGIGTSADPFPGLYNVTSCSVIANRPITNIQEANGALTFQYMGGGPNLPNALPAISTEDIAHKMIIGGQLYILRDGHVYDITGRHCNIIPNLLGEY